jgi:1,4-dihydroxy-2-naphthoate octaprenyltransferase
MSPSQGPRASSWGAWILAARTKTLPAAVAPVLVGTACAYQAGGLRLIPALAALAVALWVQIGTNFANDVFDFEKGADTGRRLGPTRAVQAGLLSPTQMRRGMFVAFTLALLFGLYLCWVAGPWLLLVGLASIASGFAYTGGPFPLAYNGLGDLFVLIFFGFVAVCGTAYVQAGAIPASAWWASLAVGALATAILVVNNLRDRSTDADAGKHTLAVRFGAPFTRGEYALLLAIAFLVPAGLYLEAGLSLWVLLPLLTAPLALRLLGRIRASEGAALNPHLAGTARLLLLFSALLATGIALS